MRKLLVIILTIITSIVLYSSNYSVVKIYDGDTVTVKSIDDSSIIRVRMYGIDAPEISQKPYGVMSRDYLKSLIGDKVVDIDLINRDKYGRYVGKIYYNTNDGNRHYANLEMLQNGYAFYYYQYAKKDLEFRDAESYAKLHKLGIYQYNITNPSVYRRLKKLGKLKK